MWKETRRLELIALGCGLLFVLGSLPFKNMSMSLAILLGAGFGSLNFRLLAWSWSGLILYQIKNTPEASSIEGDAPDGLSLLSRFVLKYVFLLAGIAVLFLGLRTHPVGFCIGVSNLFVAILGHALLSAISPQKMEQNSNVS